MKSAAPRQREAIASIPAPSATGCANETIRQTLKPQILTPGDPGALGGFGELQLRINRFVSLFAASLIALFPTRALAQTAANDAPVVRQESVAVQDRPRPEYDTDGRRLGAFALNASVDLSAGSTDNLFATETNESEDSFLTTSANARLESDWLRHMLAVEVDGSRRWHEDFPKEDYTTHSLRGVGRFDIGDSTTVHGTVRAAHLVIPRKDPDSPQVGEPVQYDRTEMSAGVEHRFARVTVRGDIGQDRRDYDGLQSYLDNEESYFHGRLAYNFAPQMEWLFETRIDEREYKNTPSFDSEGRVYQIGAAYRGDLVSFETLLGRFERDYTIATFEGLAVSGEIEWYATELTTVTFSGRHDADDQLGIESTSAYVTEEYNLRVDHELRRNVILTAGATAGERSYAPIDREDEYTGFDVGADWLLNRRAAVHFRYEHDETESTGFDRNRDFEVNAATIGLRLRL